MISHKKWFIEKCFNLNKRNFIITEDTYKYMQIVLSNKHKYSERKRVPFELMHFLLFNCISLSQHAENMLSHVQFCLTDKKTVKPNNLIDNYVVNFREWKQWLAKMLNSFLWHLITFQFRVTYIFQIQNVNSKWKISQCPIKTLMPTYNFETE